MPFISLLSYVPVAIYYDNKQENDCRYHLLLVLYGTLSTKQFDQWISMLYYLEERYIVFSKWNEVQFNSSHVKILSH